MISSRILARMSESMMCPETSITSLTAIGLRNYSGSAGRSRLVEGNLVDPDRGDGLEAGLAVVPEVAHHDLDDPGGGDGQQGADEAGQLHAYEDGEEDEERVERHGPAHDHGLEDVVLDLLVDDEHNDHGDARAG